MEDDSRTPVRLPWLSRPRRIGIFLVVVIVVAGLAFAAGWFVRSPSSSVTQAANTAIPVFAKVEQRIVDPGFSSQGAVTSGETVSVIVNAVAGADRLVVSDMPVAIGDSLTSGAYLASVSDRPLFLLRLSVPLFRDLALGQSGSDVTALQAALGTSITAKMDRQTMNAIRTLYEQSGARPPGGTRNTYVAWREIVSLPVGDALILVAGAAKSGAVLGADDPVMELRVGAPRVSTRVSAVGVGALTVGTQVVVRTIGLDEVSGVVSSVSAFVPAKEGDTGEAIKGGFDVQVDFTEPLDESIFTPGKAVTVTLASSVEPGLAIPVLAVRQDQKGAYVLRGSASDTTRVSIAITAQAQGWASVQSNDLKVGDGVQVAP